ncbi:low specificity L-threonine aldolase [Palleronia sediminis]|uniref:L-threonine aldolase n=1 Tax=Palleronia sediminis TaxID=2547833 RepID=A0A4R5ZXY6_9RHOB|nr:beta-eliminating lyase-related protein [Palleronia sediminis]TDL75114.1 low specificity L-threonine aldolase [Palleronia sediminis]
MYFASDNAGPAHPRVIEALAAANDGYAMPYGVDASMERVRDRLREIFEAPEASVHLVATGTAANALALACMTRPWETVFCTRMAHIEEDECGAPEFYTGGAKLTLVDAPDGMMTPDTLAAAVDPLMGRAVHNVQPGPVSLTTVTERGSVYPLDRIAAVADAARARGLKVHLDGARFANACAALGCTPAELSWRAGIDALSFGGTKNGLLGVEAVIFFDPAVAREFELRRKRGGHLFSKHRYLSAQMEAYLADDLWLTMARSANAACARLVAGLSRLDHVTLLHPADANIVFCRFPRALHRRAHEAGAAFYSLDPIEGEGDARARLVCDWSASDENTDRFLSLLA